MQAWSKPARFALTMIADIRANDAANTEATFGCDACEGGRIKLAEISARLTNRDEEDFLHVGLGASGRNGQELISFGDP